MTDRRCVRCERETARTKGGFVPYTLHPAPGGTRSVAVFCVPCFDHLATPQARDAVARRAEA